MQSDPTKIDYQCIHCPSTTAWELKVNPFFQEVDRQTKGKIDSPYYEMKVVKIKFSYVNICTYCKIKTVCWGVLQPFKGEKCYISGDYFKKEIKNAG